jgi:uncharacterized protein (DUF1499 family)
MRLLPLLLGLIFPACAGHGIEGLPVPPPMDFAHIERPATPNTALAAPAGFTPAPDIVTEFHGDPARIYAALRAVALAQPRVFLQAEYAGRRQIHFVARTEWANFPDLIAAEVTDGGGVVLWSRSVYGRSDFGVNRARLAAWLTGLKARLAANPPKE